MAKPSAGYLARQSFRRVRDMLDELRAFVDAEQPAGRVAADPSMFVRRAGGARALLEDDGA